MVSGSGLRSETGVQTAERLAAVRTRAGGALPPTILRIAAQERALNRVALRLLAQGRENDLFSEAVDCIHRIVQVDAASLCLADGGSGGLVCHAARDGTDSVMLRTHEQERAPFAVESLRRGAPASDREWLTPRGGRCATAMAVPVEDSGRVLGVLIAGRRTVAPFGRDHAALLSLVGRFVGAALARVRDREKIRERERMASRLVSMASHEIRTPLTALQGFSEILLTRSVEPELQNEWLGLVNKEAARLAEIVERMADLGRLDGDGTTLRRTVVRIGDVIERAVRILDGRAGRIDINGAYVAAIEADADRLEQVVTNLLRNALDYAPQKSSVMVQIDERCLAPNDDTVFAVGGDAATEVRHDCAAGASVAVRDRGRGLSGEELRRVFQPFYRGTESQEAHPGGSGLGLAISRAIVDAHGGQLWAHSRREAGTTFGFCLPSGRGIT